jgi:hypothetical protein
MLADSSVDGSQGDQMISLKKMAQNVAQALFVKH